jgi:D-inositol-3-phosphate glycosyltransferase
LSNVSRVLVIEMQSRQFGLWHYACCLARALTTGGFDVLVAAAVPFEVLDGFDHLTVRPLGSVIPPGRSRVAFLVRRLINQISRFFELRRLVLTFRPHIVHLNSPTGKLDFLYFRYWRALGARVVYTAHEPNPDAGVDWFDWARLRGADAIFAHSGESVRAITAGGISPVKITRIQHGTYLDICPTPRMSRGDAKRSLGLHANADVVLFFGAIAPYKGLDVLIQSFTKVAHDNPNAHLVIAGYPHEDFAPYQQTIDASDVRQRVRVDLRYVPFAEFPKYFGAADVVVFPYRRIQQSGALQLAYAYGRPVVATNVGGLGEEVIQDRTGIIVRAEDSRALAVAIGDVLGNKDTAAEMGRRGRHLAETKYSWSAVVERVSRVYGKIHGRTPKRDEGLPDLAL